MPITKDGISLPGEKDDKCCWCVPIKIGIYLIGTLMIIYGLICALQCIKGIGTGSTFIYGVLYGVSAAPIVMGGLYFIKFFR